MRILSCSTLLLASLLLLSACGQKGPLTLPRDEPVEMQEPTGSPATGNGSSTAADGGSETEGNATEGDDNGEQ